MSTVELKATVRESSGKGNAHKMRAQKLIPAVVYGAHVEKPLNIALDPIALRKALANPKRLNTILTLKMDQGGDRTVLLKDFQTNPVKNTLLHADFLEVRMDQQVKVKVPLAYVGQSVGVADGGVLQTLRRDLELWMLPGSIPEQIEIDVTPMKIGTSLHVKDLKLPAGSTVKSTTNFTLAAVLAPEKEEGGGRAEAGAAPAAEKGAAKKEEKKK